MPSYHLSIETPTPLVLDVGFFCASDRFCDICEFWSATQGELLCRRVLTLRKMSSRPSGSVPSAPPTPLAETSLGVSLPGTSSSSSLPLGGQEGLRVHLVFCLGGLPPLPLDLGRAGEVAVPLGYCLGRAGALPLLLLQERARWGLPARCRLSVFRASDFVVSPQFSPHVPRRENSRETS